MRQQGLQPNVISYMRNQCMRGKCKMPERALQLFDGMQQQGLEPNVFAYTAVVNAGELTLQLFDEMQQQGLQANWITYSAVAVHAESARCQEGLAAPRCEAAAGAERHHIQRRRKQQGPEQIAITYATVDSAVS